MSCTIKCPSCGTSMIGNGGCALTLSYLENFKNKPNCFSGCRCGYPIRSKEVRKYIFKNYINGDKNSNEISYCYCETRNGIGHVYKGTFNKCVVGNGLCGARMGSCVIFERYANAY